MTDHPDLAFEQAKNREYLRKLDVKLRKNPLAGIANPIWMDGAARKAQNDAVYYPLIGRVGCDTDDDQTRDFYIGPRFIQDDDIQVYSWAAPIARRFYQPQGRDSGEVVVRRTFALKNHEIVGLDDEQVRAGAPSPFVSRVLEVPAAPQRSTRRRRSETAPVSLEGTERLSADPIPPPPVNTPRGERASLLDGMRAEDAVLRRLAAPRGDRLASVLALLQPDQHTLVSWPPDSNLAVQGHPGTGKTVVAAYRAAYLVNPVLHDKGGALEGHPALRVLVVGPTAGFVRHIEDLIRPLDPGHQVKVTHIGDLLGTTTGLKHAWPGALGGDQDDVDPGARRFAELAARIMKDRGQLTAGAAARRTNIRTVYELIAANGHGGRRISDDPSDVAWMRKLPPFEQAFTRRHLPLLAQCRLAYLQLTDGERFDHIIVDEAQDISPIEWNVLDAHLRHGGHWTLVGDMNQRRSDVTYGSWSAIADHLAFSADERYEPQRMTRGYRSTGPILRFADRLLPIQSRQNQTVQTDGPDVEVRRATHHSKVFPLAVETAVKLAVKYGEGTTAIISVAPGEVIKELGRRGYRRDGADLTRWSKGKVAIRALPPEEARGLEFDAVVVVEPGAFPENLGRTGQLYTSLTRANRELAVVWHRDLPDPLRRAGRGS